MMRVVLALALAAVAVSAYGPPRPSNNGCGSGGGSGCSGVQAQPSRVVSSCGGNGCGGSVSIGSSGSGGGGSGGYWWQGNDAFSGTAHQVTVSSSSGGSSSNRQPAKPATPQQNPFVQRPRPHQGYVQPRPNQSVSPPQQPSTQNLVLPPMGICPATYVCVHWQLCRDGFVISDGTGTINKRIKNIPGQVASRYQSCGGDMICCGIPAGSRPGNPAPQPQIPIIVSQPQVLAPAPSPPVVQQPLKPVVAPAPLPPVVQQPPKPVVAPAPSQPVVQQPPKASGGYSRPPTPQNPLIPSGPSFVSSQPNPQPTVVNTAPFRPAPPAPQTPQGPISNPIGLVSPPSPQPMPMMGMMGMMGMPMRGGSCSAGTYCVPQNQCNPYNGFIIRDPTQLMAVWPDAPTVPLLPCFVPDGSVQNGVCCQEAHPNAGGFD